MTVTLTQKLEPATYPYVVVPCTFKPEQEAEYSLSLFSKSPEFLDVVTLQPAPDDYIELEMKGEWKGITAGGCLNQSTWRNNPQFQLKTDKKADMWISLSVPNKDNKEISIGFYVVKAPIDGSRTVDMEAKDVLKKGAFRKSQEVIVPFDAEPGVYNIIASTFNAGQESPFTLTVYSDNKTGTTLKALEHSSISKMGKWTKGTAGGCINDYTRWLTNPRYFLLVNQPVRVCMVLVQSPDKVITNPDDYAAIGFYVTHSDGSGNPKTDAPTDLIAKANYEPSRDVSCVVDLNPNPIPYCIVPSTFYPDIYLDFQFSIIADPESLKAIDLSDKPQDVNIEDYNLHKIDPQVLINRISVRVETLANSAKDLEKLIEGVGLMDQLRYPVNQLETAVARFLDSLARLARGETPVYEEPSVTSPRAVTEAKIAEVSSTPSTTTSNAPPPPPPPPPTTAVAPPPPPPPPSSGGPPPPPPPPPAEVSKPPKPPSTAATEPQSSGGGMGGVLGELGSGMAKLRKVDTTASRPPPKLDAKDEMLAAIRSGQFKLRSAAERKLPEKPKNTSTHAFSLEKIVARRIAIEGEDYDEQKAKDDWEQEWDD